MFSKILIANRGEIAVRIMRTCREMGIRTVAIYSDADRSALHVRHADEAYYIGASPSTDSYLCIDKIINVLRKSGAEAVHPGYGFLSENSNFVAAVEAAGAVFIGPSAHSMRLMGDKISARKIAESADTPTVPGTTKPLESLDEAIAIAEQIGYPVMLKAAAGGGGKGMRMVTTRQELITAYALARSEAEAAFKDPTVYLEKLIARPRHIELQILADKHGNYVYLGERECSIQRRNQKVIEECPSPINDPQLRRSMGEAAVRIAREAGYYNAGTIEFLVDADKNFYFLEMNTRLQVEHPVTEMVTGIDLVKEQIKIAADCKLSFTQQDIILRGHAIECRIYAEDPERNFIPSPGQILRLRTPNGPGIRDDSGVYEGFEVPIYYDPLLSKLIVWANTRQEAIAKMLRALDEYSVDGIKTTISFFKQILRHEEFVKAHIDTGFIARNWQPSLQQGNKISPPERRELAAIIAAIHLSKSKGNSEKPQQRNLWKVAARAEKLGLLR
ncbi:MAG: acetyl-CoA carboxylase biotin carboxylase subunit [Acidobacteriota bacterium]|nr:acetyl-CoA carboxylase biotin carboxylase subunit [Blastocatellia bacterium]MDW8413553.1 acetyl-CoA carboxylase biotin carboxylase subunit [Acidobacteriota bacterium]